MKKRNQTVHIFVLYVRMILMCGVTGELWHLTSNLMICIGMLGPTVTGERQVEQDKRLEVIPYCELRLKQKN